MVKSFLEELKDFKEPKWEKLSGAERGNVALTIEKGKNEKGSNFYKKNEGFEQTYRNYLAHKIFEYINKGAGKTIIPIAKHFEFSIDKKDSETSGKTYFITNFTSSAFTKPKQSADFLYGTERENKIKSKKGKMVDKYLNVKFNIPLKILGTWDLHEGNKIINLNKYSGYGIDFGNEPFKKNSYKGSKMDFGSLQNKLVKGRSKFNDAYYRYAQTLFFWHNFLKENKSNFRKIFSDVKKEFDEEIDKKVKKTLHYEKNELLHKTAEMEDKENYSAFIKNVIVTIRDTGRILANIEKNADKND